MRNTFATGRYTPDTDWLIYSRSTQFDAWTLRKQLHRLGYVTKLFRYPGGLYEVRARV